MANEERKATRIRADQFISFKAFDKEGRVYEESMALTRNISKKGVLLEHRSPCEVGNKFELQIALPDEIIIAMGIVRNVNKINESTYQIGIEFESISDEDLDKLRKEFPSIE